MSFRPSAAYGTQSRPKGVVLSSTLSFGAKQHSQPAPTVGGPAYRLGRLRRETGL